MTVAASTASADGSWAASRGVAAKICPLFCDLDLPRLPQLGAAPGMSPRPNEPRGPRDRNEARVRQLDNRLACGLPLARDAARARSPPRVGLVPLGRRRVLRPPRWVAGHQEQGCEADAVAACRGAF